MSEKLKKKGFVEDCVHELPDIKGVLHQMHYEKNGAKLLWLERKEENKTFAIAFKTIPDDNTGVFHILEHSLLCGSEKYQVSKPFVEMIKSSLQTFMNAFTYPDKTIYPLSSRNHQDFLNLMDVYLDAVFHPLCIRKKSTFLQEGWHYEMEDLESEPFYNGVVYNEMKGVYASCDTLIGNELNKMLFPDNCYCFQHGGNPENITELTYEKYVESYRRFYHPSNAYIILDGDIEIDHVLEKLDSVLEEFDEQKIESDIPIQMAADVKESVCSYEISENDNAEGKTILAGGWVYGRYDEPQKDIACSVLADALCSSDESPLKKALMEKGLAENVELIKMNEMQQNYLRLVIRNTTEDKKKEVWDIVRSVLSKLAREGLNHRRLEAILSRREYYERERENGMFPEGVVYALQMLESCLYGGDPEQNLCLRNVYGELRDKIETGYFEQLIKEVFLDNPHYAYVTLRPSKTFGEEKRNMENDRLQKVKEMWTEEEKNQVIRECKELRELQETPDSVESLSRLPQLSLHDLAEKETESAPSVTDVEGCRVLCQEIETEGIVHITYYFSLEDQSMEDLSRLSFLRMLLGETETEHYSLLELQEELERTLGRFQTGAVVFAERGCTKACRPYLSVSVSVMEEKAEEALVIIEEVLQRSCFRNENYIRNKIHQLKMSMEQHVLMSGDRYAMWKATAPFSAKGAVNEAFQGIQMLRWVQKTDAECDEGQRLIQDLQCLYKKIIVRKRATVSVVGRVSHEYLKRLVQLLPEGEAAEKQRNASSVAYGEKTGLEIPAEIGFAGKGANLQVYGAEYCGSMQVAAKILTYGYLWDTVRVKGGAYGTGLRISESGDVVFTSFRDPNTVSSLEIFDGAGSALRGLCKDGGTLDKYIISTIASSEPLLTTRQKAMQRVEDYLSGLTPERRQQTRREILHTTKEDMIRISDILDYLCKHAGVCVIDGKNGMKKCENLLSDIEKLLP